MCVCGGGVLCSPQPYPEYLLPAWREGGIKGKKEEGREREGGGGRGEGRKEGKKRKMELASGPSGHIALPATPLAEEKGHCHPLAHCALGL